MSDFQPSVTPLPTASENATRTSSAEASTRDLAMTIAQAADERKGADIRVLNVVDVSYLADYFVIVTGFSTAQVRAIARNITDTVDEQLERRPIRTEGQMEGNWVLQDYGDVIVHIFMPEAREYYGLEAFWGHAEDVPFESEPLS
jgi:ribosome-associated protein